MYIIFVFPLFFAEPVTAKRRYNVQTIIEILLLLKY